MRKESKRARNFASISKKKSAGTGIKKFTRILAIVYIIMLLAFEGILMYMNLLPVKYICIILVALTIISLIVFPMLFFREIKKGRKIFATVMAIIMIFAYGLGISYMMSTISFFNNILKIGEQTQNYYVLVRDDSSYSKISDIAGGIVYTYASNELNYSSAKAKLGDKALVGFKMIDNIDTLAEGLTESQYDVIFVSANHYKTICEDIDTFKDATRILYTVKVAINSKDISKNVNVTSKPFNIYISGLDTAGSINTVSRSDVNMVVTVNPVTHKILLTSIPRDYYVTLVGKNAKDKLTHSGIYGIEESVATIENLLGIDINYYVKVNFTTVPKLVDAIGGIDVISKYAFTTHGQSVHFNYVIGKNHLNGDEALAFSRERHSFVDGDNQRIKDQQIVVEAMIKKATQSATVLTNYTSILNAVKNNMQINMTQDEIKSLVKMQLNNMSDWDIEKTTLTGTNELNTTYTMGNIRLYVMVPNNESIIAAVDKIAATMEIGTDNTTE